MRELYKAIWRATGRRQVLLVILSLFVAALAAVPLEYQKDIINGLEARMDFAILVRLGLEMIAVIILSLTLKWALGFQSGLVGEWVIKRLRTVFYENASARSRESASAPRMGTLSSMISDEAEHVGKFTGDAVAEPVLQLGTLISVIGYIAVNQPGLGGIFLLIVVPQVLLVVQTQARINKLVAERVLILRRSLDSIVQAELGVIVQSVLDDFVEIYETRRRIFIWKLSTKFILSVINGLGLVGVLVYGGWLVIEDVIDVGTVVAATIGLNRIQQPWRYLIAFYRNLNAIRVRFELMQDLLQLQSRGQAHAPANRV